MHRYENNALLRLPTHARGANRIFSFLCLFLFVQSVDANSCFVDAETYYEQVYCEVKNNGKGRSLPSFFDFKKNNEMTQALLLKRDAQSLGLDFKMPARKSDSIRKERNTHASLASNSNSNVSLNVSSCSLASRQIQCGKTRFRLMDNRKNKDLPAHALSANNRLEISDYADDKNDANAYERHLVDSYLQYLERMQSIGLAGETMPYGRFYFLFSDLEEKGVDARARFAQMFEYLKQDKSRNAVNLRVEPPAALSLSDCSKVNPALFVCDHRGRNYLFARSGA